MVCLPAAFGFSALYLNTFTSKKTLHTNENSLFWLKAILHLHFHIKALWNFLLMQKYHWGLILQIDEDIFPLRQIRTVRNISGNRLFLWLFPSRRGAQGGRGWGLCKEWGKNCLPVVRLSVIYVCARLCVSVCENSTFPLIAQDLRRKLLGRWHGTCFSSHLIMKEMVPLW